MTKITNISRRSILILAAIVLCAGIALWVWLAHRGNNGNEVVLFGNVDLRQADLAFNNSERIETVLVQEGDHVVRGQVLARLDISRLKPQADQANAQVEAQQQAVQRLHNGNRPEEIAQAQATLESAKADYINAHRQYERLKALALSTDGRAVSQQDVDNAKAALDIADAKKSVAQKALDLETVGPRKEDIAQAEAQLRADQARAVILQQELSDAQLVAPQDGVIRARLMEPGEMASPQKPVFSLAIINPKWVRAYVSEPDMGKIHSGMAAQITVDSFPSKKFDGWVGFISPTAEFTPKTVQTEELRSSLVYEVRIFVKDPADELRLGMPATVHLLLNAPPPTTEPTSQP